MRKPATSDVLLKTLLQSEHAWRLVLLCEECARLRRLQGCRFESEAPWGAWRPQSSPTGVLPAPASFVSTLRMLHDRSATKVRVEALSRRAAGRKAGRTHSRGVTESQRGRELQRYGQVHSWVAT